MARTTARDVAAPTPSHLALADDVERHTADARRPRSCSRSTHEGVLDDLDAGVVLHPVQRRDERARDLLAGGVAAGVGDAVAVVPALAGQLDLTLGVAVELRTQGHQLADPGRALVTSAVTAATSQTPTAGDEGVVQVLLG